MGIFEVLHFPLYFAVQRSAPGRWLIRVRAMTCSNRLCASLRCSVNRLIPVLKCDEAAQGFASIQILLRRAVITPMPVGRGELLQIARLLDHLAPLSFRSRTLLRAAISVGA
jgi:hypothetical protein